MRRVVVRLVLRFGMAKRPRGRVQPCMGASSQVSREGREGGGV